MEDDKDKYKQYKHQYWIDNKEQTTKQRVQIRKEADDSDGKTKYCNRCYQNKSIDEFVCPNGKIYNACYLSFKNKGRIQCKNVLIYHMFCVVLFCNVGVLFWGDIRI